MKKGLFSSKKKKEFFENDAEDFYYGIQSKSISDLRKGFDATGEILLEEIKFAELFEKNKIIERKVEEDLYKTQKVDLQTDFDVEQARKDRAERVREIGDTGEINIKELSDEFGLELDFPKNNDEISEEFIEDVTAEKPITVIVDKPQVGEKTDKIPVVQNVTDFRRYGDKNMPIHIINIDVLQNVIEKESQFMEKKADNNSEEDNTKTTQTNAEGDEQTPEISAEHQIKLQIIRLKSQLMGLSFQMLASAFLAIIMIVITILNSSSTTVFNVNSYIITNLVMLFLGTAVSYKTIINGVKELFTNKPSGDSSVAVAFMAVVVHMGFSLYNPVLVSAGVTFMYTHIILIAYFCNFLGKYLKIRRIYGNLKYVGSKEQKYTIKIFEEYNVSLKLAEDTITDAPVLAYQKKCKNLDEFIKLSYMNDPSDYATKNLAPLALVLSMILCIIAIIEYKSVTVGMGVLAGSCCMTLVIANTILINLPVRLLCKKIRRFGAMITNYESVEYLSRINAVMIDSTDIFPDGAAVLEGLKTFGDENKEDAILCARCLLDEVGGILKNVMDQVVDDSDTERVLESYTLEDEHGISGIVNGKEVLVGTRTLMMNHGIEIPDKDDLVKYIEAGRNEIFIALNGVFSAMMIISYRADKRKREEIKNLENNGISIIVRATDPNITNELIAEKFGINKSSVNVVNGNLGNVYKKVSEGIDDYAPVFASTKGRVESMASAICHSKIVKSKAVMLVSAQTVGVLIGFIISLMITVLKVDAFTPEVVTAYLMIWSAIMIALAKVKK